MTQITEAVDVAPRPAPLPPGVAQEVEIKYYTASQFQLMWWKFKKHKLALIGSAILGLFVFVAAFAEFLSPYAPLSAPPLTYLAGRRFCTSWMPRANSTCARLRMRSPPPWTPRRFCSK